MGLIVLFSCKGNSKSQSTETNLPVQAPDAKVEIEKWKNQLLQSKQIGHPCTDEMAAWSAQNPDQLNGLPSDENDYASRLTDVNGDGRQDLLLYFISGNCTGHNGGTPTFARLIYSDGGVYKTDDDLMGEIKNAILKGYDKRRDADKTLGAVTNNYMDETTTISGYDNGIKGEYRLYADDDPHCCPSYTGTYVYDVQTKTATIENTAARVD